MSKAPPTLTDELQQVECWIHNACVSTLEWKPRTQAHRELQQQVAARLAVMQRDAKSLLDLCEISPKP